MGRVGVPVGCGIREGSHWRGKVGGCGDKRTFIVRQRNLRYQRGLPTKGWSGDKRRLRIAGLPKSKKMEMREAEMRVCGVVECSGKNEEVRRKAAGHPGDDPSSKLGQPPAVW